VNLSVVTDRPARTLGILSNEKTSLEGIAAELDAHIAELQDRVGELTEKRVGLGLIILAIENDMDRIRNRPTAEEEQLELQLDA
jgi:hypothetical protein